MQILQPCSIFESMNWERAIFASILICGYGPAFWLYLNSGLDWFSILFGTWLAGTLLYLIIAAVVCPIWDWLEERFTL